MGAKLFLTDEINDANTATVTNKGQLRAMPLAQSHVSLASAASSAATVLVTGPAYLKSIILGSLPGTATSILISDTALSAYASAVALDVSGANKICKIVVPAAAAAATAQTQQIVIPLDVYCTSGITYALGCDGSTGNLKNVTIVYQDL